MLDTQTFPYYVVLYMRSTPLSRVVAERRRARGSRRCAVGQGGACYEASTSAAWDSAPLPTLACCCLPPISMDTDVSSTHTSSSPCSHYAFLGTSCNIEVHIGYLYTYQCVILLMYFYRLYLCHYPGGKNPKYNSNPSVHTSSPKAPSLHPI